MQEFITNQPNDVVAAIDIGTTKVCALVGRKNQYGKMDILGIGKVESEGVMRGVVTNIEKTVNAIKEAVSIAERGAGFPIRAAHVGIAGQHIKSLQHRGILMRDNTHTEISQRDIDKIISDMYKLVLPPGDKIIHVIPQEYAVDNEQGITDPIGMSGVRLEANFHIITGQITASNNIYRCVERCGLKVLDMTLEPIASAMAVLSDEEKEAGVALVDIGGGTTDITIFYEGIIRHTAVVPFGGNVITKDVKEGCTVMQHQAEKLKVKFGSALAEEVFDNRIITIPGLNNREHKEISEKNLALIIQARMEEILDYALWEIRRSGFEKKLIGGIVLTGGGSLLRDLDKLCEYHTGMITRIGIPIEHLAHGYDEQVCSPIYATGIGLLMKAADQQTATSESFVHIQPIENQKIVAEKIENVVTSEREEDSDERRQGWLESMFKKTKEWFEAEPDKDF